MVSIRKSCYIICTLLTFSHGASIAEPAQCDSSANGCHDLGSLLAAAPASYDILHKILAQPEKYQPQIIYTRIDRSQQQQPLLTEYHYQVDDSRYFYPASTVKLPVVLLALQWLHQQQRPDLTADSIMLTDSARPEQTAAHQDQTAANQLPSIAHYIKKVMLVSDNDGYNRLYELLGPDYINQQLQAKGLANSVINHRLSVPYTAEQNRYLNPVRFVDPQGQTLLQLPARGPEAQYYNHNRPGLGLAYYQNGQLITEAMDFTFKNRMALTDLDSIVKRLIFPQLYSEQQQFALSAVDRDFMLHIMSALPGDSDHPAYSRTDYPDNYGKYLMFGGQAQTLPANIKIFNKTGSAYGQVLDVAYIQDQDNGIEFFVSAVVYVNDNQILNDDTYQTKELGLPFMNQLGNYLYQLELQRLSRQ